MFDRVAKLFQSFLNDLFDDDDEVSEGKRQYADPDMQDAWDELNDFLNDEDTSSSRQNRGDYSGRDYYQARAQSEMEELREDFKILEVPFGASYDIIKASYKKLILRYHPDKHANDPEKLQSATEMAKRINTSFNKLKKFYKKK